VASIQSATIKLDVDTSALKVALAALDPEQRAHRADLALGVCHAVEALPASEQQTALSERAAELHRLLRALVLGLLALLPLQAAAWEPEPAPSVEASIGAGVSVSDSSAVVPVARVVVDAPVYAGRESIARIRAALQLHGSPDSTVNLLDVRTFQGAELSVELERRIGAGNGSATYLLLEGGGAARRDARGEGPRERFPGWWSARIGFEHRDEGKAPSRRLTIGLGSSQVVHPLPNAVPRDLMVTGHVDIPIKGKVVARMSGDVQRCLWGARPGDRSVFRLAVMVGI
jgi:hypothetical protein